MQSIGLLQKYTVTEMSGADEMSLRLRGNFRRSLYGCALKSSLMSALELNHKIPDWIRAMPGMSGRKYRYLINRLVESLADARYLEVGSWKGSSLCSAIWANEVSATSIDNWSQFGGPKAEFLGHVSKALNPNVQFQAIDRDFRQVDWSTVGKANIYFFDGPHSESDQYDGIVLAQPALDPSFVLIVDDFNWPDVRNGTSRAINDLSLAVECSIEVRSTQNDLHPAYTQSGSNSDWHNGYFIAVVNKAATAI
jgi:hypothetical protein